MSTVASGARYHEDDEQHQHHVDKRRDVDLVHFGEAILAMIETERNNLSDLYTHVMINQLNEEIASVENANSPTGTLILGTDLGQFVGRSINDIHRDIIDIAQGDPGVQALFNPTPLLPLNLPAMPFLDNTAQTTFITQWIQDSDHLGQAAVTIENNGFTGDIAGLVQQIQIFENNANAFDQSQGGLWSAVQRARVQTSCGAHLESARQLPLSRKCACVRFEPPHSAWASLLDEHSAIRSPARRTSP
jgi:hypothetical protein